MGRARSRRRRGKSGGVGSGGTRGGNSSGSGKGSGKGSGSGKGKGKGKNKNRARQKLNKKIQSKKLSTKVKSVTKAVAKNKADAKKKTISASQSRRQVRQRTRDKIATRKKINMPSLGQIGRTLRNIRQPMSMLSNAGVRSFLGRPAQAIAQGLANSPHTSDFNKRTRDMSKLSPQQRRKYERLSAKTGRDYSIRNPTFRLNMGLDTLANFGGFADNKLYRSLPKSIRSLKVDKQFYGNPMKKGWHSSQRTGRGQGVKGAGPIPSAALALMQSQNAMKAKHREAALKAENAERQNAYNQQAYDMSLSAMRGPRRLPSGVIGKPSRSIRGPQRPTQPAMGPQQDWLGSLYSSHNISGGKLDQGARDYWSNEAKTKGRDAVTQSIIGTSKAQGTYGGRKKPQRISTGSSRSISTGSRRRGGGGPWGIGIAAALGLGKRSTPSRKGLSKKQVGNLIAGTPRFF